MQAPFLINARPNPKHFLVANFVFLDFLLNIQQLIKHSISYQKLLQIPLLKLPFKSA